MSKAIITGVCGFIGSSLARRLLARGDEVVGIDNLSRAGSELNAADLIGQKGFQLLRHDLSNLAPTLDLFAGIGPVDAVFHLAAQVAVTTSYVNRITDFNGNTAASFNVIESVYRHSPKAYCLYASTNKVYGHLLVEKPVGMEFPLSPYTPYGVSKAVGELYFTEFGRHPFSMATCCLRQSCIYGHHQYGVEDQGWVAWLGIANLLGKPITIYGDGNQVRDLLFIDDLIDLYLEAWQKRLTGVYPVGGGQDNAISFKQGIKLIEALSGKEFPSIGYGPTRHGDQPYFVANLDWTKAAKLDWKPQIAYREGLRHMLEWARGRTDLLRKMHGA
jgi:CDP-paratose 2-epimerase